MNEENLKYFSREMFERYASIADDIQRYVDVAGHIEYQGIRIKTALIHELTKHFLKQKDMRKKKFGLLGYRYIATKSPHLLSSRIFTKTRKQILSHYEGKYRKKRFDYVFFMGGKNDNFNVAINLVGKMGNSLIIVSDLIADKELDRRKIRHENIFFDVRMLAKQIQIPDVNRILESNGLEKISTDGINTYLAQVMIAKKITDSVLPKKVIGIEDTLFGKVHESLGWKSVIIETLILDANRISSLHYNADQICVYGQQGKERLLSYGVPEKRIIVTGNPILDVLSEYKPTNNSPKKILYATSRIHDGEEKLIKTLADYCKGKYHLTVKLHPKYNAIKNNSTIEKIRKTDGIEFVTNPTSQSLLLKSDMLITDFSSTGIHSRLIGKPTIFYNLNSDDMENKPPYIDGFVYDVDTLLKMIDIKMSQPQMIDEKFVKDFNYSMDGKALERMAEVLRC